MEVASEAYSALIFGYLDIWDINFPSHPEPLPFPLILNHNHGIYSASNNLIVWKKKKGQDPSSFALHVSDYLLEM